MLYAVLYSPFQRVVHVETLDEYLRASAARFSMTGLPAVID